MTTLAELDHERALAEAALTAARSAWEIAQADYAVAIDLIRQQRQGLLAERILDLEKEIAALRSELPPLEGGDPTCPYCGYVSPTHRGLRIHIKRSHPAHYVPTPEPTGTQTCPTCGKKFARLASHYYGRPECNPAYHEAAEQRRQADLAAQASLQAARRRADAEKEAAEVYARVSEIDRSLPGRFVCAECGSDTHTQAIVTPHLCVRCAAMLRTTETALFVCEACARDTYRQSEAHPDLCVQCAARLNGVDVEMAA